MKKAILAAVAALAFASVAHAQPEPGRVCGGFAGGQCGKGQYCELSPGVCGRVRDARGVCKVKPRICPEIFAPVCGCNHHTYGNECAAAGAGVSVLHRGHC
jgi:hypothetical protein